MVYSLSTQRCATIAGVGYRLAFGANLGETCNTIEYMLTFSDSEFADVYVSFSVHSFFSGLFTGHDPTRGLRQGGFKISRVGSGRVGSS